MNIFHSFILGAVQGLTEFLPVSSSAHLILLPKIFNFTDPGFAFDVFLHLGTLFAVVYYFRIDLWQYLRFFVDVIVKKRLDKADVRFKEISLISISFVVTGVLAFLLKDFAEEYLRSTKMIAWSMLLFSVVMYLVDKYSNKIKKISEIKYGSAILIGLMQVLAIAPGVSRSGSTIVAGLLVSLKRQDATRFSFLLSLPIIASAIVLEGSKVDLNSISPDYLLTGFVSSFIFGYLAIRLLTWVSNLTSFLPFVIYRVLLAVGLLLWI